MTMSTIPIGSPASFPRGSAEQSSSPELSDELTTALAAGRWWAILEVSCPISEEPEYGDFTSGQWWGTMEAGETSCPSSLVFSDASENTGSLYSDRSDATLKTTEQWRQKKRQEAPVSASSQQGHLTSSLVNGAYGKAKISCSNFSDVKLKTTEQQRKRRQKKPQWDLTSSLAFSGASEKPESTHSGFSCATLITRKQKMRKKKPQGAPVPDGSPRGAPVPSGSRQRGKLRIPEHLTQHLLKASLALGITVPGESPQEALKPVKPRQRAPLPAPKVLAGSPHGPHLLDEDPEKRKPKISKPLVLETPQASSLQGEPATGEIAERKRLKIREALRRELLELNQRPRASFMQAAPVCCTQGSSILDRIPQRRRLKIRDPLRQELLELHQKRQASSSRGSLIPVKSPREPPVGSVQGAAVPPNASLAPASFTQAAPVPSIIHVVTPRGALEPTANFSVVLKEQRQKWREQQHRQRRQKKAPKPPQGASTGSQLTRKRALENADVVQSPPQKKQRVAVQTRDQQEEPASLKEMEDLCSRIGHFHL